MAPDHHRHTPIGGSTRGHLEETATLGGRSLLRPPRAKEWVWVWGGETGSWSCPEMGGGDEAEPLEAPLSLWSA